MIASRAFVLTLSLSCLAACLAAVLGCRATQRVDLPENGYRDALACVATHEGQADYAASECEKRGFAYFGPEYKRGYLEATACIRAKSGSAQSAAGACSARA